MASPGDRGVGLVSAEDDFGERYTDLTPSSLDALVDYVTSTGGYLVVERADLPTGQFAQVILEGVGNVDLWAVQVCDDPAQPHDQLRAVVDEMAAAQRALRAWSFNESDWRSILAWER
ncbi:hypothetical protein DSM112329_02973 [Paraconexibacter sp. AEG42_29]|uniref:Uncharacterized protein n=1 Tax=Paraconexibacter sp. AEG42_29 TaxID=2997339 RepID=A0AAU7AWQ1_9ACTN